MSTLKQHLRIATKPARALLAISILGILVMDYAPAPWKFVAGMIQMFTMGILTAQHMPIWAPAQEYAATSSTTPESVSASVTE